MAACQRNEGWPQEATGVSRRLALQRLAGGGMAAVLLGLGRHTAASAASGEVGKNLIRLIYDRVYSQGELNLIDVLFAPDYARTCLTHACTRPWQKNRSRRCPR